MKLNVSAIILTFNEASNLRACLESIKNWCREIIIVDSFSSDQTLEIAKEYNSLVFQHEFQNQADQFNWALDNLNSKSDWILRLDADERMTEKLWHEIKETLTKTPAEVNGFFIKRRVYFMGKWIRHGGYYPTWLLRLFRKGKARSESRKIDEHIVLTEGLSEKLKHDFIDQNLKDLKWWLEKHKDYSSREAEEIFALKINSAKSKSYEGLSPSLNGTPAQRKRWLKNNIYLRLPLFIRPFLYFIYRYFFRLGFLDGAAGLMFHFLQGFWYRFLVDLKVYNLIKRKKQDGGL